MIIENTNVDLAQKPSFCQTPVTGSTGFNVLSLFDGMSCGQIALQRAGIKVENYFASEIDKYAIQVAKHNYPNTKHIGSVVDVKGSDLPQIDLLIGGSPCQGFSFAGKQLNFDDPRSKLFFEFVRLKNECNPTYFLLENVKMKKEHEDIITEYLGVKPIAINSELFSAQDRKRIYWTNINFKALPTENKLTVEDILEDEVDVKYYIEPKRSVVICENEVKKRKIAFIGSNSQGNRIYNIHGKSVCLCGEGGGLGAKTGLYALPCLTPDRLEKRQNGRRFKPSNSKFYTLTAMDKHGILTDNFIRKLTPIECERLQTVPDNYTKIASDNQRYRMLGNGWTVDVIAHIFGGLS
ncbi:MAG TPA: DNA (cytosine-5-)-methyltransferase [Chitinophagales bacterium]|nr:DNA (cytosine-5-)-methyltransferase [Chitinophagales bacterium]HQW79853.1 DNA (cytosine-5-)-methyltransferase [Chitinophagales bacterium]